MHQPHVLLHQPRPSHQILLHQACNAVGVFNVRVIPTLDDLYACLACEQVADVLVLDHAIAPESGMALLEQIANKRCLRALLFVGQANEGCLNLANEARRRGLWVLAELPWPLPMPRWQQALQRIQTVISPTQAH
ncbi:MULTISPECIES: hypothetical protein [Pseudomonas]|uniref:hypothetical protein n=1 Tax=Pseudomonas TaxID=286 RepID=UPI0003C06C75|nr:MULTISPECIES: hypothetical protein [Pseudomonas]AGZ36737.1 hypothetical protein PVLB_19780 [Pseudomonas sp. VLB120]MDT8922407.1 histidine kinase [Pseudomonas taiwanensis]